MLAPCLPQWGSRRGLHRLLPGPQSVPATASVALLPVPSSPTVASGSVFGPVFCLNFGPVFGPASTPQSSQASAFAPISGPQSSLAVTYVPVPWASRPLPCSGAVRPN
ncbi:hypothetical protein PBY51_013674 [Eleginops maclovinus]|uniref:Uncharacterized protein n=1 Tax=Eleginops maclovinus TaxID=56733 RepID=A0AAN8AUN2_ELEMC|nr:hypothetical protein PBY51_013674 [Eleginops maclovinus]